MPISGHKEYLASLSRIPLKKRRFPLYQPPSPPPETPALSETPSVPAAVAETPSVPAAVAETPSVPAAVAETPSVPAAVAETPSAPAAVAETPSVPAAVAETPSVPAAVAETPSVSAAVAETPSVPAAVAETPSAPATAPSLLVKPEPQLQEQPTLKPESSPSNAGSQKQVSALASSSQEEISEHHAADRNVNLVLPIVSPPTSAIPSGSGSEMNNKGKLVLSDKTAFRAVAGNTELKLAPNQALPQKVKQEVRNEGEVFRNDTDLPKKLVTTDLLLAEKKILGPDVFSQDSRRICEDEKLDPSSWNLALTGGQTSNQGNGNITEPKIDQTHPHDRSNWDLNKMMDTWDGSENDSATVSGIGGGAGLDATGKCEMQHVICSTKVTLSKPDDTLVASGKQILEKCEHVTKLSNLSTTPELPQQTEDLLHLRLSTPNVNIPQKLVSPSIKSTSIASRIVKFEPSDTSNRKESEGTKTSPSKSVEHRILEHRIVKSEPLEGQLLESNKSSQIRNLKLVDNGNVKVEPVCRVDKETVKTIEGNSVQPGFNTAIAELPITNEVGLPHLDGPACTIPLPVVPHSLKLPTTSEVPDGAETSNQSTISTCITDMPSNREDVVPNAGEISGTGTTTVQLFSGSVRTNGNQSKVSDDTSSITRVEGSDVADPLQSTEELHLDSVGNGMVAESDEEKLNIFDDLQEDDCSSDSDDEQDASPAVGDVLNSEDKHHGGEDDDYEDGEVREPLLPGAIEAGGFPDAAEHGSCGVSDMDISDEETNAFCPAGGPVTIMSNNEINDTGMEDPGETKNSCGSGECDDTALVDKHISAAGLQEPSTVGVLPTENEQGELTKAPQRTQPDCTGIEDGLDSSGKELVSNGAVGASQGTPAGDDQSNIVSHPEHVIGSNPEETKCSDLSMTEPLVSGGEAARDVNSGGNRSRIINLARAFNEPYLGRTRSTPGRSLPSRVERERIAEVELNGDKLHFRGNRDESSMDGGHKFERQRNRDQPVGSNGPVFMHGRGRTDKIDFARGDWGSDRNFAGDDFNSRTDFRFSRQKNPSKIMVSRDVTHVVAGRKQVSDELPSFRHPPGRRRSPGGREGPVTHGVQMVRRPRRNISPDRCIGGDAPALIGLRHEEKFIRGLQDDMIDPVFSRPQPRFQQVDNPFRRGDGSFSPIQRRGPLRIPRIRSKSPGTRPRSPGPWSSPRRRSPPEGFDRSELIHRRSPPFYRMERVRSPRPRPCFPEDIAGRRPGSPPFMSRIPNDMREMDTREHDHPRPFIPNRSPSGRVLPRGTRRFNMIDPRERMENNEFYAGPMHSGRFHEIEGDEGADERRICGERRGPVRSFRPPFDAAEVENFQFDVEGGPRQYRFSPEEDAEFHERGNLREREFERRVKNRPGNVPRRNRSIEEPEENFRQGEPGWHGAAFEDVSRVKRRRF